MRDYKRLDAFLDECRADVYPEPYEDPSRRSAVEIAPTITKDVIDKLVENDQLRSGARVLDVGCGRGLAIPHFLALGCRYVGISLGTEDLDISREVALESLRPESSPPELTCLDQSFIPVSFGSFDLIWARHVLEHSPFPYFTLKGLRAHCKTGGFMYAEVPSPDTIAHHETNPNHYSVLPKSMWRSLFKRSGFVWKAGWDIKLDLESGPDWYWGFILEAGEPEKESR